LYFPEAFAATIIADGAIGDAKLDRITDPIIIDTTDIANLAIVAAKIALANINYTHITQDPTKTIITANLRDALITTAKIANLAVDNDKLAELVIAAGKLNLATPFLTGDSWSDDTPAAGSISWNEHTLVFNGVAYTIVAGNTSNTYVYFDGTTTYATSNTIPTLTNSQFNIAVNNSGVADLAWMGVCRIPTAIIGTAAIADAAIATAKIADLAVIEAKIDDLAVGTAKIAELAVVGAKIANATIGSAKIIDLVGSKITANSITAAQIAANAITAAEIAAGIITADKFISTLYGDLNQAMDYVKKVLGAGDEYSHDVTAANLAAGTFSDIDAITHADYGISIRIATAVEWDDGGAVWDTGTWDEVTDAAGSWTSASTDLGSSMTLQTALRFTVVEETPASTTPTITAIFSSDDISWGTNAALNDDVWETLSIANITGDVYKATGALRTFRYFKIKVSLATTDTSDRIILHTMTYLGNVVTLFGQAVNETIASGGTVITLNGFNATPAVTVTPVGAGLLIPLITAQSSNSVTVKLYNLAGNDTGGSANITIIGV